MAIYPVNLDLQDNLMIPVLRLVNKYLKNSKDSPYSTRTFSCYEVIFFYQGKHKQNTQLEVIVIN